jgi:hypothetical protein
MEFGSTFRNSMSDSITKLDEKELLRMVVASAQVIVTCVYELRRRQFDMSNNDNYFMACSLVRQFYPHITHQTLLCYVGNLRDWLEMAEEDLPPVFCITSRRRTSLRKLNELKCTSVKLTVDSNKVHGIGSNSSDSCGGIVVTKAAAVKSKKVTMSSFVSHSLTFFQRTAASSPSPRSSPVPSKKPSPPVSEREELPYPKDTRDTRGPSPGASSYQDFVDVFCQAMWNCPESISVIVEALGVQFRMHQKKYGRQIVPDRQLSELMESIAKLDSVYTCAIDCEFKQKINADGWYSVSSIFSKHEALLVAIMSLAAENWTPIRNRHGWTNAKELKQNRCMSFTIALVILLC